MNKNPHIGFRVNPELKERLVKEAKANNLTLSQYIIYLVRKGLP